MTHPTLIALLYNAALLLAMVVVFDIAAGPRPLEGRRASQVVVGLVLGAIGLGVITTSFQLQPGIVFDTRSVLLAVSGLFFGAIPTVVAMVMTSTYRLMMGGVAAWPGVVVIVLSGMIGIAWRRRRQGNLADIRWGELYRFGTFVHLGMLVCMMALPWETALRVLGAITLPVLLIFPAATTALGLLLANRLRHERNATELAISQARYELANQVTFNAIWEWSLKDNRLWWNPNFALLFGQSDRHDETSVEGWKRRIHDDDRDRVMDGLRETVDSGRSEWSDRYRFQRTDGTYADVEDRGRLERDRQGRAVRMIGAMRDVTEQKRAEARTHVLATALNAAANSVAITDPQGQLLWVNPAFSALTGYTSEEVVGQNARILKSGKHGAEFYRDLWETILAGRTWRGQFINRGKGGQHYVAESTITPVQDTEGRITHFIAIKQDITERKRREEQLRAQAALLDLAQDAISVRDMQGQIEFWNKGCERLLGWTAAETLGKSMIECIRPDPAVVERATQALRVHGQWSGELELTSKSGLKVPLMSRWTLVRDELGQPRSVLIISTDMTEQKKLEARSLRTRRLEALGSLSSGIAHDLNNILAPILMTAPFLRDVVHDEDSLAIVRTIEDCAQRGADTIRQLLTFARGAPGSRVPLQVEPLLRDVERLIRETFPRDIQPRTSIAEDLWPVLGDATQVHQTIINLCVNARDAMPDGGNLTLVAENASVDANLVAANPGAQAGPHVVIRVTDTGTGIPAPLLDSIFDPFFTTKEAGKGTGLGLATVLGIVRSHGGFLRVESQVGSGSMFELYYPAAPMASTAPSPGDDGGGSIPAGHGEWVLVVDDEAAIRDSLKRTLQMHGYQVLTAAHGKEALAVLSEHRPAIRAVIADMMMPVMDGPTMIRALRKSSPDLIVLGMTGLPEKPDTQARSDLGLCGLLTKPFNNRDMLVLLGRSLQEIARPALHDPVTSGIP